MGLKKTFTGPDGAAIDYIYDENNRISRIAIPGQGQITYNTYQWNSPTRMTLARWQRHRLQLRPLDEGRVDRSPGSGSKPADDPRLYLFCGRQHHDERHRARQLHLPV